MNQHPPAIVRSAADLRLLAQDINAAHKAAEEHGRKTLEFFKHLGDKLIKAKDNVGHGQWGAWIEKHVHFSQDQAGRYMRVAREWDKLRGTRNLEEALRYLTQNEKQEKITTSAKALPDSVLLARKVEGVGVFFEELATTKGRAEWYSQFKERYDPLLDFCKELPNMPSETVFSVPAVLNTPEFLELWKEWLQHRKEKRNRLTPTAARQQLADLASWGLAKAIEALKVSLRNGYIGVFEPGARREPDLHAGGKAWLEKHRGKD